MTGCRSGPSSASREKSLVRVASVLTVHAAPLHLAEELGYFEQAGLKVEIHHANSDTEPIPLLATGQMDVAMGALTPAFVNTVAKGRHLRIVGSRLIASPTCGATGTLYGNRNVFPTGLSDLRLLKGKRVAVTSATALSAFCLDMILATAGLSVQDVNLVSLHQQESIAALIAGKLDAMVVSQFDNDLAVMSPVVVKGIGLSGVLPNFQIGYLMFGPSLLEGDPRIGTSFLAAYLRGVVDFMAGKTPKFLDDYARSSRLDPEKLRQGCHDWFTKDGKIDPANVGRLIDWMVARGFCPQKLDAAQLIDTRFVDAIESRKRAQAVI
jgi:ABC-type nitrate/sulfonate/bicarbonate transport system substrate-binding protein